MTTEISREKLHTPMVSFSYDKSLIGKSTGTKIYRGATLLTPGDWTDSISRTLVEYPRDILRKCVNNWEDFYLNLDHSHTALDRIGVVSNPRWEDNSVKGDLHIYPITQNAKDIIGLIDNNLINWMSVEILTKDTWNFNKDMWSIEDMKYFGAAVVTLPASKGSKIKQDGPDVSNIYYDYAKE